MTSAAVYGTGSWGTAFASVLADAGTSVTMWGRRAEVVEQINAGTNEDYLPELRLPSTIRATTDPAEAGAGADIVVLAVPSQTLRDNLTAWGSVLPSTAAVVSLMKGVELGTTKRMSEVICEVGGVDADRVVVVSGPNLAREIAVKQPAASVVASTSPHMAELVAAACAAPYFRPYTGTDVVGTEIAGAVKNVIALAVGMAEGLGMGDNSKASIITRGLAETMRLGLALGGESVTFAGLAGVGDLIATCMSPLSRNHSFGVRLGQGMAVSEVVAVTKQTAEGVKSCTSILELARKNGVDVPIIEQVDAMIQHDRTAQEVVSALLSRPRKAETGLTPRRCGQARSRAWLQVAPEVVDVLDADREAHEVLGHLRRLARDPPAPLELALDAAEARRVHPHARRRGDPLRGIRARRPPRSRRCRPSPGAAPARRPGGSRSRAASSRAFACGPLDAQVEGAQAAQREPDLHRPGDAAVQRAVGDEPLVVRATGIRAAR